MLEGTATMSRWRSLFRGRDYQPTIRNGRGDRLAQISLPRSPSATELPRNPHHGTLMPTRERFLHQLLHLECWCER
jgi:hypothetical protein